MSMRNMKGVTVLKYLVHFFTIGYFSLASRVEAIEQISRAINKKITRVLSKLEDLEDEENKKKKHMSKLMDSFVDGEELENVEEEEEEDMGDDDMSDMGDDDMGDELDSDNMGDDEM